MTSNSLQDLFDQVLVANLRRCCICREEDHVQIHHIDGNRNNNVRDNLAVLCLKHHSRVTGDEGLGRRYQPSEVRVWKRKWEALCAELDEPEEDEGDEEDEDDESTSETISVGPGDVRHYSFELDVGEVLAVSLESDRPVHLLGDTTAVFDEWTEADDGDEPETALCTEQVYETREALLAEDDGDHTVWIWNDDARRAAKVKIHIVPLEADDDDEDDEDDEDDDED